MRRQILVLGNLPREVVIDVGDLGPGPQDGVERRSVRIHGDIEHRDLVPGHCGDLLKQINIPLHPGDKRALRRRRQAQLKQRANAVGIPIEYVVASHIAS